jgi:hypothetical protein
MNLIMRRVALTCLVAGLGAGLAFTMVTPAHAEGTPSKEYKIISVNFGTMAGASQMDKSKTSQEEALNKYAKEGWRLQTTAAMANGTLYLYLER